MNTLEILWVILNALGVFYSVKLLKEDDYFSVFFDGYNFLVNISNAMLLLFRVHRLINNPSMVKNPLAVESV